MIRGDTTQKWEILGKNPKFFQQSEGYNFFFVLMCRPSLGLFNRGVTKKIPQLFLGFFRGQSSMSRHMILVFRFLKMCFALLRGSDYFHMIE